MKLILVRHGETEANRLRQYIGRTDVHLNEVGREQAREAARNIASFLSEVGTPPVTVHKVFHSPYERTRETALLIMQHLIKEAELSIDLRQSDRFQSDTRLAELHFGDWEGLTYEQAELRDRDRIWAWYDDPWQVAPPNGERLSELASRVAEWSAEVATDAHFQQQTMLVVSHGGPLRWFLAEHVLQDRQCFHTLKWAPGQVRVCSYDALAKRWKIEKGEVLTQ